MPRCLGKIPLPLVPTSFNEFNKEYEKMGLPAYKYAVCMKKRVERHAVADKGDWYPPQIFFDPDSQRKEKLNLLKPLEEEFKKELSNKETRVRAQDYVEMRYIIQAIKKLASYRNCLFDVPSIMEWTEEEMKGEEHLWEWITVHT